MSVHEAVINNYCFMRSYSLEINVNLSHTLFNYHWLLDSCCGFGALERVRRLKCELTGQPSSKHLTIKASSIYRLLN